MPRKRHTAEEIVTKLRQVDVLMSQGRPVAEAVRTIGVTEVTYYRWRSEYGGSKAIRSSGRTSHPDISAESVGVPTAPRVLPPLGIQHRASDSQTFCKRN